MTDHDHGAGASYQGTVVLDIGGEVGALVIVAQRTDVGREIEVSLTGATQRSHMAVRERRVDGNTLYCAVYPGLVAGRYTIWRDEHTPIAQVQVGGAEVAEFTWPHPTRPDVAASRIAIGAR